MRFPRRGLRVLALVMLGSIVLAAGGHAQDDGTFVDLPADWQGGETYRLELVKQREDYAGPSLQQATEARTLIDVEVLNKREDGFVIRWTFGRTEVKSNSAANAPVLTEMMNLAENLRLDMLTDDFGSVAGLENKDEVAAHYRMTIDRMIRAFKKMGLSSDASAQLQAGVAHLAEPDWVEATALNEPSLFYAASGGQYELGVPLEYEDNLPNPLGGRPFPSKAHFLLLEVNPDDRRAVVEWRQSLDPGTTTAIMRETMTAMAQQMGQPPPADEDLPPIRIEDKARFLFDTETGWPISVSHERNMVLGAQRRIDRMTFRVIAGR